LYYIHFSRLYTLPRSQFIIYLQKQKEKSNH